MNIYTLQAGRDTDALIAERVFHYRREKVPKDARGENGVLVPPGVHPGKPFQAQYPNLGPTHLAYWAARWSTEILDALRLWDHLATAGWQCSLVHKPFEQYPDDRWVFHGVNRLLLVSGLVLWFPQYIPWSLHVVRQIAVVVHAVCFLLTVALFIIHVYMGTAMERGAFGSVIRGDVSRAWASKHHSTWYQQLLRDSAARK